jgi:NAD(P)-dependent dehydrogenase (short-subunit alcohol dehydrogenase family)
MDYNPFSLENKVILITGASSGIGRAIAIECSKAGATVILSGRDIARLEETKKMLMSGNHSIQQADLSEPEAIDILTGCLPQLDGVVNCAGMIKRFPLKFINNENFENLMRINFFAPALLTQKLYKKKLLKQYASVVFISSVAYAFASIGNIMYMSSKGALNSYVKGIALEFAGSGIRANAILPGMIKTNLTATISDAEIEKDVERYPLGRYGKPEEIAYASIYLLSDASLWTTGSLLTIDGGLTLK